MKIAIVEDCKEHSDLLKKYVLNWSGKTQNKIAVQQFYNAEQFLFFLEEEEAPDVVFMDIQMPGLSGIELARLLRKKEQETAIVFTTGIDDYIAEGYELEAVHYLIKPLQEEKISLCLDKIIAKSSRKERYVVLHGTEDMFRIKASDIWWVEAEGHHVMLGVMDSGEVKRIKALNSIGDLQDKLLVIPDFAKTHRSYLVNLIHVKSIRKTDIVMDNGTVIPLSRRIYKEINERFIRLFL